MDIEPGARVRVILKIEGNTAWVLGSGVYDGERRQPWRVDPTVSDIRRLTKMDLSEEAAKEILAGYRDSPFYKTSHITLDNGDEAWGNECWWGREARISQMLADNNLSEIAVRITRDTSGFPTGWEVVT